MSAVASFVTLCTSWSSLIILPIRPVSFRPPQRTVEGKSTDKRKQYELEKIPGNKRHTRKPGAETRSRERKVTKEKPNDDDGAHPNTGCVEDKTQPALGATTLAHCWLREQERMWAQEIRGAVTSPKKR